MASLKWRTSAVQGKVYAAFGSHCGAPPYYPWIFAFDAYTLQLTNTYTEPPMSMPGPGIWQSGAGDWHAEQLCGYPPGPALYCLLLRATGSCTHLAAAYPELKDNCCLFTHTPCGVQAWWCWATPCSWQWAMARSAPRMAPTEMQSSTCPSQTWWYELHGRLCIIMSCRLSIRNKCKPKAMRPACIPCSALLFAEGQRRVGKI